MRFIPTVVGVATVVACTDIDLFTPTIEKMAGDYTARVFLTDDSFGAVDWIAAGGIFTISLAQNGTTSGHLFLPGGGAAGADVNEDMAGTWLFIGGKVFFEQTADTFVRNMDFVPGPDRLSGDHTSTDGTRFRVVLTK